MSDRATKRGARRAVRWTAIATAGCIVAACASVPHPVARIARVNPASIAAAPATWDGREVEMVGLVVWEGGDLGLYQSYGAYCRGAEHAAIAVHWPDWPGVTQRDSRRRAVVRGIFRNAAGAQQAIGPGGVATATPGPGPLEPGAVVSWLSEPERPCPNRR